ncbi:TlpA family protein disulfide reductase [Algoriphagus namhaensis]
MAIKERLGFSSPPSALRCVESLTYLAHVYLAQGISHTAQRSVCRGALFHRTQGSILREAYFKFLVPRIIPIYLMLIGICCTSPSQSQVADSPEADFPHRSVLNRGGETRSDTFIPQVNQIEASEQTVYTSDVSAIDGGSMLRSPVSGLSSSKNETASLRVFARSDDPLQRTSDIRPRASLPSPVSGLHSHNNFGLVESDQDMGAGEGTSSLQPAPVTVLTNPSNSRREIHRQTTETRSLVPNVLLLESKKSSRPHKIEGGPSEALSLKDSLTIGDQVPSEIVLDQVLNVTEPILLDDLRGKYVLLQFWAPSCTGSIASLPKVNQLLSGYRDQIELIPITTFPEPSVKELMESYPSLKKLQGPMVVNGSGLRTLFPHSVIPHFVLLDQMGKVLAITGLEDITRENLDQLVKGESIGIFRLKSDRRITLGVDEKLIAEGDEIAEKNIWFQSALTGYIPNVNGSLIQNFEGLSHIRMVNMPLFTLYRLAYSERSLVDFYGRNRMETLGFGEEELFTDKSGADYIAWAEEGTHVFGYELIAPPTSDPYALMREDLRRFFPGIRASVQTRKQKVYALVQQEGKQYPEAKATEKSYKAGATSVSMRMYPLQGFVFHLNYYYYQSSPYPIMNLTGIDYPIDMDLNAPLSNLEQLTEALRKVGLDLVEREEEINVLVLEKTKETNPLTL